MRALTLIVVTLLLSSCGQDKQIEPTKRHEAIVNGTTSMDHPAVGVITAGGSLCTATLVGKYTVLTAAHCVTPGRQHYFIVDNKYFPAKSVQRHPQYTPQFADFDMAVAILNEAPSVMAAAITTKPPKVGQELTLVGFGATSGQGAGSGIKRVGTNTISQMTSTRIFISGAYGAKSNLCFGDSGGPTFATIEGNEVQVGVHSTIAGDCGIQGHDMRVDVFADWISQVTNGDVSADGKLSPLLDNEPPVVEITAPSANDPQPFRVTIEGKISDNQEPDKVELFVDGELKDELQVTAPEFSLRVELTAGAHELTIVGHDTAGNTAEASIAITVMEPLTFGEICATNDECTSGLCAGHPALGAGTSYCTDLCEPTGTACPSDASCIAAGADRHACSPPPALLAQLEEEKAAEQAAEIGAEDPASGGGCSIAPAADKSMLGLLLLGLLALARRRGV